MDKSISNLSRKTLLVQVVDQSPEQTKAVVFIMNLSANHVFSYLMLLYISSNIEKLLLK